MKSMRFLIVREGGVQTFWAEGKPGQTRGSKMKPLITVTFIAKWESIGITAMFLLIHQA